MEESIGPRALTSSCADHLGKTNGRKMGPHALTSRCADPFVLAVRVVGDCESGVLPLSLGGSSQGTQSTVLWIYRAITMTEREREERESCVMVNELGMKSHERS
jgi:hypothetical protein